jgi:raw score 11.76
VNPETGKAWDKAEYAQTINPDVLKAKPLTDEEINALEAFLKTLTDEAYEE